MTGDDEPPRERGGENILFGARLRSKVAKKRGDALGDLAHRDVDTAVRHPAPSQLAEIGIGGELVPPQGELRDTVTNPDYVTVDASRDRLNLADLAGVLELALDASDTIDAKNSLEKMLVHQMAVLHRSIMKLTIRMEDMQLPFPHRGESQERERNQEICRLAGTVARLTASYQSGMLTLQRVRAGGRQVVTVQHVHVAEGGQAVVAAKISGRGGGGRTAKRRRGASQNGE
jgi:hypothetical protein